MSISTKLQKITEDNKFDIDLANLYSSEDNFDEFNNKVYEAISCEDVIYYSEAMKYLSSEDSSLGESLELAGEYGYETENLSSELLATLLYQSKLTEQWNDIYSEVEGFFKD